MLSKIMDEIVIWTRVGLSTPVQEEWHRWIPGKGKTRSVVRFNADVRAYNEASEAVAGEFGIEVVDLFTPLWEAGVEKVLLPDGVHLNHIGGAFTGRLVAHAVLRADRALRPSIP